MGVLTSATILDFHDFRHPFGLAKSHWQLVLAWLKYGWSMGHLRTPQKCPTGGCYIGGYVQQGLEYDEFIYIYMYITPGRDKTEMTQAPFWHCSRSSVCCNCVHLVWCNAPEKYMFVVFVGSSSVSWWKKSTMLSMAILGTDWLEVPTTYIYKAYFSGNIP